LGIQYYDERKANETDKSVQYRRLYDKSCNRPIHSFELVAQLLTDQFAQSSVNEDDSTAN
jgi:hypothetical protein